MDIDALHSTLLSMSLVSDKLRAARENLPANGHAPVDVGNLLDKAEGDLRVAKATLAWELGFRLCPRCWPPELTAIDRDGRTHCPTCGHISYENDA
jgi:ribosomal protein S27AE